MNLITGKFSFTISTNGMTPHDFDIAVSQDFDAQAERNEDGGEDLIYRAVHDAEVEIMAGDMLLWSGDLDDMSGWLKDKVQARIAAETEWGDLDADAKEAIENEREDAAFRRAHAAGMI